MKRYAALFLALLLLTGCGSKSTGFLPYEPAVQTSISLQTISKRPSPSGQDLAVSDPRQQAVDTLLSQLTPEEKVGQLFFARCPAQEAASLAEEYHLGGYLLFGRDFKDKTVQEVQETIASYQSSCTIPMLIGVDEEGGSVVRVSSNPALAPSRFPSPQQLLSQQHSQGDIFAEDAWEKSNLLLSLGINVNFAPVADVSTNPDDFIYDRTLGQDARATASYVTSVVAAMQDCGIGSVLKHFPGYGNNTDTHTGIAVDERPYETFLVSDFLPFQAGIAAGADSILVSHNIVTSMDGTLPASLSPEVHRILRENLDFHGVILTDDLAMDAIDQYAQNGSAAVLALLAGNDMIVTTDFTTQISQVLGALEDGTLTMEQIDQAAARVLGWKYDLGLIS